MSYQHAELQLGRDSESQLIHQVMSALGFTDTKPQRIPGKSGLLHDVDGIGFRDRNAVLVLSGAKELDNIKGHSSRSSPKDIALSWTRDAVLRMYDVAAMLKLEGYDCDLFIFENSLSRSVPACHDELAEWTQRHKLPNDFCGTWRSASSREIETLSPHYLPDIARSVGACYLGLEDMNLSELSQVLQESQTGECILTKSILAKLRVSQFFNPPTDEFILGVAGLAELPTKDLLDQTLKEAQKQAHSTSSNTIVKDVDYNDPISTALALEEKGFLEYEATLSIKEPGREIVHRIRKTPQEAFMLRVLKSVGLPDIAKTLLAVLKGP